jgi:hypothetical protein
MRAKPDVFSARLDVAPNRLSDGTWKCRPVCERSKRAQRAGAIENYNNALAQVECECGLMRAFGRMPN